MDNGKVIKKPDNLNISSFCKLICIPVSALTSKIISPSFSFGSITKFGFLYLNFFFIFNTEM